ncbi:methylcrotonoyl-CoA carboxylase subunit alpha [Tropilaelaps mercedesae]|uniref:Methylcrotonoyl-CoA carboxylase subunit alpha n=1 Tax=Tropilaelaps mercedesae TaxID=418985 RepID=A0A1V9XXJ7_9ACAR|nr:methylcrotonoyl-CoA carboxylase subunit alpha [Tropilaelaps mercedesae]
MAVHVRLQQLGDRVSRCIIYRLASSSTAASPARPAVRPIKKLLIANRGEIACRIARSARRMGVCTVAVYSDADINSKHVYDADEAFRVGEAAASESYLLKDRIIQASDIDVAKRSGVQAIHPGYGFLSENVEFAEMCHKENIIFVGPPINAIRDMGIKSTSKHIMSSAGVPIIEGYHGEKQADETLLEEARRVGFPVMLKAVRGGGGKGMRIATNDSEFTTQLKSAKREALKAFGDDMMLVEKFVANPRHVEVQVFGDTLGNYVYLFERDCSVQRRHQKIIEETPAPGISDSVRKEIGQAAIRAAQAVNYVGAGTVEFVMDSQHNFYFMEMNTRLQVEHPITEMVTGVDLVEWQLLVASGQPLPLLQEELSTNGHAFEARVYAEDPKSNFMPAAGVLKKLRAPRDARVDTGVREGDEVSVHYDPMVAKLIVWGPDRQTALAKLNHSLSRYIIAGIPTNIPFLMKLSAHPSFQAGEVHTEFIQQHGASLIGFQFPSDKMIALTGLSMLRRKSGFDFFRINTDHSESVPLKFGGEGYFVDVTVHSDGSYTAKCGSFESRLRATFENDDGVIDVRCELSDEVVKFKIYVEADKRISTFTNNDVFLFDIISPAYEAKLDSSVGGGVAGGAVAPMPGVIEQNMVKEGDRVFKGQPLVVMIAMKMEYVIKAAEDGVVSKVLFKKGDSVARNEKLVEITAEEIGQPRVSYAKNRNLPTNCCSHIC